MSEPHLVHGARRANSDLWRISGILDSGAKPHSPYIVVDGGRVAIWGALSQVLAEVDSALVLWQWPGKWRSDFFATTVGELRAAWQAREGSKV